MSVETDHKVSGHSTILPHNDAQTQKSPPDPSRIRGVAVYMMGVASTATWLILHEETQKRPRTLAKRRDSGPCSHLFCLISHNTRAPSCLLQSYTPIAPPRCPPWA